MNEYRFDDAYENVYKLADGGYWFYCTYIVCGITAKMSDSKKLQKVGILEDWRADALEYAERKSRL